MTYWLWLTSRKGMDSVGALTVLDHFVTPERAYYADPEEYDQLPLRPGQRTALLDKSLDEAESILERCEILGLRVMTFQDADYPDRLRQLADPPAVLYIRGKAFRFDDEVAIGVVGTRQPSDYGLRCAARFGMELAKGGALVISGIAQGLDTAALKGALKGGGPVASVLAGGVDVPFPPENRFLFEDVAAAGALISENPPGSQHLGYRFPLRNRILSGLCLGILAVECKPFGGTISTVNHAVEQDRDIFAIPGALDAPMSEGTNRLIQQGAKLVTCGRDILEEYWSRYPAKLERSAPLTPEAAQARLDDLKLAPRESVVSRRKQTDTPEREAISRAKQKERFTDDELALLAALAEKSRYADELVELTQIPTRRVLSALTMLQVQQAVEEGAGRRFSALIQLE
jgi:DNA processing protein